MIVGVSNGIDLSGLSISIHHINGRKSIDCMKLSNYMALLVHLNSKHELLAI